MLSKRALPTRFSKMVPIWSGCSLTDLKKKKDKQGQPKKCQNIMLSSCSREKRHIALVNNKSRKLVKDQDTLGPARRRRCHFSRMANGRVWVWQDFGLLRKRNTVPLPYFTLTPWTRFLSMNMHWSCSILLRPSRLFRLLWSLLPGFPGRTKYTTRVLATRLHTS